MISILDEVNMAFGKLRHKKTVLHTVQFCSSPHISQMHYD